MKLLLDGVEVPWPAKVEIVVDPAGEKAAGLDVTVRGGRLWLGLADEDSLRIESWDGGCLDLRGWYTIPSPAPRVANPPTALDAGSAWTQIRIGCGNPPRITFALIGQGTPASGGALDVTAADAPLVRDFPPGA